jgi:hypothetical protein
MCAASGINMFGSNVSIYLQFEKFEFYVSDFGREDAVKRLAAIVRRFESM